MRKPFYVILSTIVILSIITFSCDTKVKDTEEPAKIENTLQSVSLAQDTVGFDPTVLLEALTLVNEVIDEIGYPDAGYKLWMRESDTSGVRFMIEGLWPDHATYDLIHDNQLYIDAMAISQDICDALNYVIYYRFEKVK